jgi:hypothetical protein
MRFASGLLPQLWLNSLRGVEQPDTDTVKDWFAGGAYAVSSLPATGSFTIVVHDEHELCGKLASEINKWASAAFETVASITPESINKRATAWPLIQLYYASFFAAHTIMRSFGRLCSQLDTTQTRGILNSGIACGLTPTSRLTNGFYRLRYNRSLGTITGDLMDDSHADTWREFWHLLDDLSRDVLNVSGVSSTKIDASGLLDDVKDVLSVNGSNARGNWLSQFRNAVNYQKGFGVWYPYEKTNLTLKQTLHLLSRWRHRHADFEFDLGHNEARRFIETSTFIIWLSRELVLQLSEARHSENHFLDRGGLDFLRFAKWHQ